MNGLARSQSSWSSVTFPALANASGKFKQKLCSFDASCLYFVCHLVNCIFCSRINQPTQTLVVIFCHAQFVKERVVIVKYIRFDKFMTSCPRPSLSRDSVRSRCPNPNVWACKPIFFQNCINVAKIFYIS